MVVDSSSANDEGPNDGSGVSRIGETDASDEDVGMG